MGLEFDNKTRKRAHLGKRGGSRLFIILDLKLLPWKKPLVGGNLADNSRSHIKAVDALWDMQDVVGKISQEHFHFVCYTKELGDAQPPKPEVAKQLSLENTEQQRRHCQTMMHPVNYQLEHALWAKIARHSEVTQNTMVGVRTPFPSSQNVSPERKIFVVLSGICGFSLLLITASTSNVSPGISCLKDIRNGQSSSTNQKRKFWLRSQNGRCRIAYTLWGIVIVQHPISILICLRLFFRHNHSSAHTGLKCSKLTTAHNKLTSAHNKSTAAHGT